MHAGIYTDLAAEARDMHPELPGVREETEEQPDIHISRITVEDDAAAQKLGKEKGRYITLDAPQLAGRPLDLFTRMSEVFSRELAALIQLPDNATVLIVGLGNRAITPDSLGPRTVEQVYVTRHVTQYLPEAIAHPVRAVCAVAPGVLGVTGIETMELVRGAVEHVKPDLLLVIDSLASRRAARISTTVQLSNAGIRPGSGVGNARAGVSQETFHVPVIAIGVPTVVFASTISRDVIGLIAEETGLHNDEEKLKGLAEKVIEEHMDAMIVTPKDIDTIIEDMSRILADGINMALFGASYAEVRALIA